MLQLTRTVRFCLSPDPADGGAARDNTFSAWPAMRGLGRYYELHVTCRGEADARTGYFINIKHIDAAVRDHALPQLRSAITGECADDDVAMGSLLLSLLAAIQPALHHSVTRLALQLTPMICLAVESHDMDHVLLKQQYEFSAAHRLHVPEYSDKQNREIFGKCNNPAGHGHNYRIEAVVKSPVDPAGHTLAVADLDAVVDQHVIEPLDHKHLNQDVPQFAKLNPSVEHIAQVIWDMLAEPLAAKLTGASLHELSVWETGKTVCTYHGPRPRKII